MVTRHENGVEICSWGPTLVVVQDMLHPGSQAPDRAENFVASVLALGSDFIFDRSFLEFKGDGDISGSMEFPCLLEWNNSVSLVPKFQVSQLQGFGTPWGGDFTKLAGAAGEEETTDDQKGCFTFQGTECSITKTAKEARRESGLLLRIWVHIAESFKESFHGREQVGTLRDLEGRLVEIAPERLSHDACGISDRA